MSDERACSPGAAMTGRNISRRSRPRQPRCEPSPSRSTARRLSAGPMGWALCELHGRTRLDEAILYAFDLLELNGEDLRPLPFKERKARLAKVLARARAGQTRNGHSRVDGAAVFAEACRMGLEGIVSKRIDAPYRSGRSGDWVKTKNPDSPAAARVRERRF